MSKPLRLAVLISGSGSNLQAIIDAIEAGELNAVIETVVSNNPDAFGLERAQKHGLPTRLIDHRDFDDRAAFDAEIRKHLDGVAPDFIVLAGYMRIMTPDLVSAFANRILNIHPSLLPAYKGLDTHRRALDSGEARHGVSIHLVTAELDDGPILLQGSYPIEPGEGVAELQEKGHRLEHRMYPHLLRLLSDGKLIITDGGQIRYEQKNLDAAIQFDR